MHEFEPKTEEEQRAFFEDSLDRYRRAAQAMEPERHLFDIGGTRVCLEFAGPRLVPTITRALEHLRIDAQSSADFTVCLWDSESTGVDMVPPPCDWQSFTNRGDIWGFNSPRYRAAFHWVENSVNLMDRETNQGLFWVATAGQLPFWVHASPLRTHFHWWMEENDLQLLHAACVGDDDGAVLIVGKGGVGKSTTALTCLRDGLNYLADDYLIVGTDPRPTAYTLYSTAKLDADQVERFPGFRRFIDNADSLESEKAVMFLHPDFSAQIRQSMPLKAVLLPRVRDQVGTDFSPADARSAQRAAAFTTLSQLPYAGRHTHDYLDRLTAALPKFNVELGSDLKQVASSLSEFLASDSAALEALAPTGVKALDSRPLVSVVIPTYNGEKFLPDAIASVLAQDYPSLEIVVIDDGSDQDPEPIVEALANDVRFYRQENAGPAAARNRGIRDASNDLIAFLDVDDLWPANNLHALVAEMTADPSLQVVHGYAQVTEWKEETGSYEYLGNPEESFPYYIGAGLYRRSAFERVGLFDEELTFGEDKDWYERAQHAGVPVKRIDQVTLFVRRHGGNMTSGKSDHDLTPLRAVKKALDRMRAEAPGERIFIPPNPDIAEKGTRVTRI
jgi:hypothetical protein